MSSDISDIDIINQTLLEGIEKGDLLTVAEALYGDADPNYLGNRNSTRLTPLMKAFQPFNDKKINLPIIELLLEKGAKVNLRDSMGRTALRFACEKASYCSDQDKPIVHQGVELLLNARADPDLGDNNGYTPLMLSAVNQIPLVNILLNARAEIDLRDSTGMTALMIAVQSGITKPEMVKLLLQKGANPNLTDNKGMTPLMISVSKLSYAMSQDIIKSIYKKTELLLIKKAEVDLQNNKGITALMIASMYSLPTMVEILLVQGANPAIEDNKGKTALMYAYEAQPSERKKRVINLLTSPSYMFKRSQRKTKKSKKRSRRTKKSAKRSRRTKKSISKRKK